MKWSLIICFFCVTAGAGHWAEAEVIGNHPLIAQQHQWQEIWQIPAKYFSFWAARVGQGWPRPQVWTLALCSLSWDFTCSWWQVARIGRCKLELGGTKTNIYLTWYIDKWGTSLCIILHSLSLSSIMPRKCDLKTMRCELHRCLVRQIQLFLDCCFANFATKKDSAGRTVTVGWVLDQTSRKWFELLTCVRWSQSVRVS